MTDKRAEKRTQQWIYAILAVAGLAFTGFGWFVTQPTTIMAMVSTISFGFGLVVLIWALVTFDDRMTNRWVRFALDLGIGLAIVALIYVFMLGFKLYAEFAIGAGLVVLVLALLFAARKVPGQY